MVAQSASAQNVSVGGLIDLELKRGQEDSSPTLNQTPSDKWSVYTPNVRLFFSSSITDRWMASAALQSDHLKTGNSLSYPYFSLLNINWLAMPESNLSLTFGRFITPFGLYSKRLLSSQNPFVHYPLTMSRYLTVDSRRGFYTGGSSYEGVTGMPILYQRLYSQGIMLSTGSLSEHKYQLDLAAVLISPSSHTDFGEHNRPALLASANFNPWIWYKLGFSLNYGPYMKRAEINRNLTDDELQSYDQLAASVYSEFSYHYFILTGEYTWNRWEAPWIGSGGNVHVEEIYAPLSHYLVELQYRIPNIVGLHTAVRFEQLIHGEATNEGTSGLYYDSQNGGHDHHSVPAKWTPDFTRVEMLVGYDINRQMELKVSYLLSRNSGTELDDDVFTIQLSAGF